jgi:hypothetical protein
VATIGLRRIPQAHEFPQDCGYFRQLRRRESKGGENPKSETRNPKQIPKVRMGEMEGKPRMDALLRDPQLQGEGGGLLYPVTRFKTTAFAR